MQTPTTGTSIVNRMLALLLGCVLAACAEPDTPQEPPARFEPTWASLAQHNPAPDWFRDAKFGIYFHWGVYAVPAFGSEWYPRLMHIPDRPEHAHHVATYGDPTVFSYADFVPRFTAENFDPDEWADLFQQAGARFAGPVAEHHDGFSMWDSELTPWNTMDKGPKRDITGELAEAIRARGMRLVTTFHHARNNLWEHDNNDGAWNGHYSYVKTHYPTLLDDPEEAILYGYMPRAAFLEMWKGKLVEVIDAYQPDLMWFDSWLDEIPDSVKTAYLAYYFNRADAWGKEVVVTYKQEDLPRDVAMEDFEKGRTDRLTDHSWLTDDTISKGSWCYTQDLQIKSTEEVLHTLIDIVSKNGQLLLNISPRADGTIPDDQRAVLLGLGAWLDQYGEAIYGTRPFVDYGEGPTQMERGGHFLASLDYTAQDIRYTRHGNTVYAILLGRPDPGAPITMTLFGEGAGAADVALDGVELLGSPSDITWEKTQDGLHITAPAEVPDALAIVFKLTLSA